MQITNPLIINLLEILKYIIPAIIVMMTSYMIVKKFLVNETERKRLAIFQEGLSKTMMLRLQAYERLSIFVERMSSRSLVPRVYHSGLKNSEFQFLMIKQIQEEFEHNLSQQIYVSNELWKTLVSVKEQEMAMINSIASRLNPENPAKELSAKLTEYIREDVKSSPIEIALEMLNNEAKILLASNGA